MDLEALILANGHDYLLRRIVDRAACSKCRGVEISVTSAPIMPGFYYGPPATALGFIDLLTIAEPC